MGLQCVFASYVFLSVGCGEDSSGILAEVNLSANTEALPSALQCQWKSRCNFGSAFYIVREMQGGGWRRARDWHHVTVCLHGSGHVLCLGLHQCTWIRNHTSKECSFPGPCPSKPRKASGVPTSPHSISKSSLQLRTPAEIQTERAGASARSWSQKTLKMPHGSFDIVLPVLSVVSWTQPTIPCLQQGTRDQPEDI